MSLRERYRLSHRYRRGKLIAFEIAIVLTAVGAIAASSAVFANAELFEALLWSAFFFSVPGLLYGYVSANSQFLTPAFGRLRVTRDGETIVVTSPPLRWVILLTPAIVLTLATAGLLFVDETFSGGGRADVARAASVIAVLMLLPMVRSGFVTTVRAGVVDGRVTWGPLTARHRTDPVEAIVVGEAAGVRGDCMIERTWLGRFTHSSSNYHSQIDVVVLNNAYFPLTVADIEETVGVPVVVAP